MRTNTAHSNHHSTETSPEAKEILPAATKRPVWRTNEASLSCQPIEESHSTGQLKLGGLNFSDNFCKQLQLPLWS